MSSSSLSRKDEFYQSEPLKTRKGGLGKHDSFTSRRVGGLKKLLVQGNSDERQNMPSLIKWVIFVLNRLEYRATRILNLHLTKCLEDGTRFNPAPVQGSRSSSRTSVTENTSKSKQTSEETCNDDPFNEDLINLAVWVQTDRHSWIKKNPLVISHPFWDDFLGYAAILIPPLEPRLSVKGLGIFFHEIVLHISSICRASVSDVVHVAHTAAFLKQVLTIEGKNAYLSAKEAKALAKAISDDTAPLPARRKPGIKIWNNKRNFVFNPPVHKFNVGNCTYNVSSENAVFIVLDLETTSLCLNDADIIQVGAKVLGGHESPEFNKYLKRGEGSSPITTPIEVLTGISDSLLDREGISFQDMYAQLKQWIAGIAKTVPEEKEIFLIAHNGTSFDFPIFSLAVDKYLENLRTSWMKDLGVTALIDSFRIFFPSSGALVHQKPRMEYYCSISPKVPPGSRRERWKFWRALLRAQRAY